MNNFFIEKDIPFENLGNGVKRKILAHRKPLMIVEVNFEKDSKGDKHSHPHSQIAYILEGKFKFFLEDKEMIVSKGDSVFIESNLLHGIVCLEEGKILDIFSPEREDFLK